MTRALVILYWMKSTSRNRQRRPQRQQGDAHLANNDGEKTLDRLLSIKRRDAASRLAKER